METVVGERYELRTKVGQGAYGRVYFARDIRDARKAVAVKIFTIEKHEDKHDICYSTIRELCLLRRLGEHPNLPTIHKIFRTDTNEVGVAMDWLCENLWEYMDHYDVISTSTIKAFTRQLCTALHHCHIHNALHRDVKPANIMISPNKHLTLCDFGLARICYPGTGAEYTQEVVTLWYRPPELLMGWKTYDGCVDMWAVGAIVVEMVNKRPLFPAKFETDLFPLIRAVLGVPTSTDMPLGVTIPEWATTIDKPRREWSSIMATIDDPLLFDFVDKLLCYNPQRRMTAKQALDHPWLHTIQ